MRLADFHYDLPPGQIAQHPPRARDGGRLMVLPRAGGEPRHATVRELPQLLPGGALLVVNRSRVIPARLHARRPTGGRVELLVLEREVADPRAGDVWRCMVRASRGPRAGEELRLEQRGAPTELGCRVLDEPVDGRCRVRLPPGAPQQCGAMPLPPYIQREEEPQDRERYQTIYAAEEGSIAAPTAGLHFTAELLERLEARGIERVPVTLHVGPGTFQPVRCQRVEDHRMEQERYEVPTATAAAIEAARVSGRPVVAVGTTVVRTLESTGGAAGGGRTELFITPGHEFRVVDGLLTNFHLPGSTLLMLVAALVGRERLLEAYDEAVRSGYRFYSYGDAMLIF